MSTVKQSLLFTDVSCYFTLTHTIISSVIPHLGVYKVGETAVKSAIALDVNTADNPE